MWQPTPSTPSSSSTSDNKNNADDCKCSGDSQQTTSLEHKPTLSPADLGVDNNKKLLESTTEEATDSGFISGPQSTASASSSAAIHISSQVVEGAFGGAEQKVQQSKTFNSDSGCIEEESSEQMLLKYNVETGMSERLCKLSLQNNSNLNNLDAPKGFTQQQQKSNITPSSASVPSTSYQQHAPAGSSSSATTAPQQNTTNVPAHITPANAWEYYYQQNDEGDTPLHLACISGLVDVVAALIRMAPHPCLFNIQNDQAQTPLHLATLIAHPKIIRMLLIAGAEPTIRDRHGNTALHLACMSGEEQCVRALTMSIGASEVNEAHRQYGHRANDKSYLKCAHLPSDLEIRNYDGERCVHLAAQAGYIDILRILVLYGADINAREGKSGRTPLHIAIECCNEDLANFLLDECQKLNLETATYAGLTAYQVACVLNKSEMQDILEKRGAEPLTPPDSDYDSSDIETDLDDSKVSL
ncbi:NF-kappa-B inhibitor cactus-like isoform X2 [Musca domestica]|uniref:NF-kappa-B inhibitor cactus-like isoform X2 n=1 Tax=Musca domestica TaxID=7370 RepID=A0ABM3UUJ3_MUSDO|nr:NF-kappa-B inhibitor cactus-like isoform X2 [Musca domestica]